MKGSSSSKSVKVISNIINISPFTSNDNLVCWTNLTSTGTSKFQDKKKQGVGFKFISLKNPQSRQPYRRCRTNWSKEVENIPSLYALDKDIRNAHGAVGSSLGYTDTSHWCYSPLNKGDGHYKLPGLVNVDTKDIQQDNVCNIGTSMSSQRMGENEELTQEQFSSFGEEILCDPVSLSFEEELKRKNVKVLTPYPATVYKALPIVSETYPVMYIPQQPQHEPFKGPGFHYLKPSELLTQNTEIQKSKIHSTIIQTTESRQAQYMLHSVRERHTSEDLQCSRPDPESALSVKRARSYCGNLRMLSADGNVVKSSDLCQLPIHNRTSVLSSETTTKSPLIPLIVPRKKQLLSTSARTVINGRNRKQTFDSGTVFSANSKPLYDAPRRKLTSRYYTPTSLTQQHTASNPKNKTDFILISRPVRYSQNGLEGIATKEHVSEEDMAKKPAEAYGNLVSQSEVCETFRAHGINSSLPTSNVNHIHQDSATPKKEADVTNHTGGISKISYSQHGSNTIIIIPTAENVN